MENSGAQRMRVNVYILRENIILRSFILMLGSGPGKCSQYSNSPRAERSGSRIPACVCVCVCVGGGGDFPYSFTPALGPPSPCTMNTESLSPGVKRSGRGVNQ